SSNTENVEAIFKIYSRGVATSRDAYVYDFNHEQLITRVQQFIDDYNAEVFRYQRQGSKAEVDSFVNYSKVKWSRDLKLDLKRGNFAEYQDSKIRSSMYRPYCKQYLFFDRILNEEVYVFPSIFPTISSETENKVI